MSNRPANSTDPRRAASESDPAKARRQDEILAAAFEEFAANGYSETRLDDIAHRAGIAKGTIYLYFKSKERLFCAVLRGLTHRIFRELEAYIGAFSGSAEELLREIVSLEYAKVVANPNARAALRLFLAESNRLPELSAIYLREVITPGTRALRQIIAKGIAHGEFRKTKLAQFPQVLAGPTVLAVVWILIMGEREPLDWDGYMEAHLDVLLHGLVRRADSKADRELLPSGECIT